MSDSNTIEAWVSQVGSRTSLAIEDPRTGKTRTITTKGKGGVLRIAKNDRVLVEEKVRDVSRNPFRNGTLVMEKGGPEAQSPQSLSDDDLAGMFELDTEDFASALAALTEVNVRRLRDLSVERNASYNHVGAIKDYIEEKYSVGGDTETYRQIMADRSA